MGITSKYSLDSRLKSAHDFEEQGENLHAIQIYNSIIEEEPDFAEGYFSLAGLYEKQGNVDSAIKLLTGFISDHPSDSNRINFAQLLLRNSRWESAIDILNPVDINEEPMVSFFTGYAFFMLKDFEPARINFRRFISSGNKTELLHETYIYLAKIEIQLNNFKDALTYAKKSEIVYSNFWELNLIFAIIYYHLGMSSHSVSFIRKAVKLNPDESVVYLWAGRIYLKTGEYLKAEENFLKHIDMHECPSSEVYSELADIYMKEKKIQDAIRYFDIALKLNPLNQSAVSGRVNAAVILQAGLNEN